MSPSSVPYCTTCTVIQYQGVDWCSTDRHLSGKQAIVHIKGSVEVKEQKRVILEDAQHHSPRAPLHFVKEAMLFSFVTIHMPDSLT